MGKHRVFAGHTSETLDCEIARMQFSWIGVCDTHVSAVCDCFCKSVTSLSVFDFNKCKIYVHYMKDMFMST